MNSRFPTLQANRRPGLFLVAGVVLAYGFAKLSKEETKGERNTAAADSALPEPQRKAIPISMSDLSAHTKPEQGLWATHFNPDTRQYEVFDLTGFYRDGLHPGGQQALLETAGGSLDAAWARVSPHHFGSANVAALLGGMRIGYLTDPSPELVRSTQEALASITHTPEAHAQTASRIYHSSAPQENSEVSPHLLTADITLPEHRFRRNNHASHEHAQDGPKLLEIVMGEGPESLSIKLTAGDLEKIGSHTQPVTVACAGRLRASSRLDYPAETILGISWDQPVYSTMAKGPLLAAVLDEALSKEGRTTGSLPPSTIVRISDGSGFSSCIPVDDVLTPTNGQAPLIVRDADAVRLIHPGHAGHRSVKDVRRIELVSDLSGIELAPELERLEKVQAQCVTLCPSQKAYVRHRGNNEAPLYDSKLGVSSFATTISGTLNEAGELVRTLSGRANTNGKKLHGAEVVFADEQGREIAVAAKLEYPFGEPAVSEPGYTGLYQITAEIPRDMTPAHIWTRASTADETQPEKSEYNTRGIMNNAVQVSRVKQVGDALLLEDGTQSLWRFREERREIAESTGRSQSN